MADTEYSWQDYPSRTRTWRLMHPWTTDLKKIQDHRAGHPFTKINPTRMVAREVGDLTVLEGDDR